MFVNCFFFLGSEDVRNTRLTLLCSVTVFIVKLLLLFLFYGKKRKVVDILTLKNEYVKNIGINKNKVKLEYYLTSGIPCT